MMKNTNINTEKGTDNGTYRKKEGSMEDHYKEMEDRYKEMEDCDKKK